MKKILLYAIIAYAAIAEEAKQTEQFVRFTITVDRINPTEDSDPEKVVHARTTITANREQLVWFRASETNSWECLRATPLTPVVINSEQTAAWTNQAQLKGFFLSKAYEKLASDELERAAEAARQEAAREAARTNAP